MDNYKIKCDNVSKKFRWYERSLSVKESFTRIFKKPNQKWEWYVLKNINFNIKVGEHVGIIGRNGSGKTTLLKLFSSIYLPSEGTVNINCNRRLALIELGVGFYPELTGRENIMLNWVINGLPKKELKDKFDKIVSFAEVEKFIDTPLKFYSSGMTARLGFSIAINADPDLLIIDEILAVGDAEFQQRCYEEIKKLCEKGITLILVSHNDDDIKRVCDRVIWLENGTIKADGETIEVLDSYKKALTL
jgi:ABC-type polysaccharide/polyol phosphate transport system ATPase subunit